jgi:imidazolonepropionase-like amidohydrolase
VRVLDFKAGGFTEATSLLVEDGRIKWIGSEASHTLSGNLNVVDGGGRFAIPGLFDVHCDGLWCYRRLEVTRASRFTAWAGSAGG